MIVRRTQRLALVGKVSIPKSFDDIAVPCFATLRRPLGLPSARPHRRFVAPPIYPENVFTDTFCTKFSSSVSEVTRRPYPRRTPAPYNLRGGHAVGARAVVLEVDVAHRGLRAPTRLSPFEVLKGGREITRAGQ